MVSLWTNYSMEQNESEQFKADLEQFRAVLPTVAKLEMELATHEVQCEERWKTTFNRLETIETTLQKMDSRMLSIGGTVILFLAGVLVTLLTTL
jgi:hypothetical protein